MAKKVALTLCFLIFAVLATAYAYIKFANPAAQLNPDSISAQRLHQGSYAMQWQDVELIDSSRRTDASGDYAGSETRTLITRIWWPEKPSKAQPLLIYSHGFMSTRIGGSYIAEHLASQGYVVAAADFPLTNYDFDGDKKVGDVINQPGDVSFIIDQLLQRNQNPDDELYGRIDPQRIAVAGMSLGGMTTEMVAYHPQWGDDRIKVAVSIAGPSSMFSKAFFKRDIPFLMVATPTDAMVDYRGNAADITERVANSILVTFDKASHAGFSFQSRQLGFLDNPDQVGCWAIAGALKSDEPDDWFKKLGTTEQGIVQPNDRPLCQMDPLPKVMHPIYQQQLNQLAVTAFLQCHLSDTVEAGQPHCEYLQTTLPAEVPAITVSGGA